MKQILFVLIISMVAVLYANGQRISPTTHSSCGASLEQSGVSLDYTLGNTVIETCDQNGITIYQGFHFPNCAPEGIGYINGCDFLCAQDTHTVYRYKLAGVLNADTTLWSFSPASAVEIDSLGSDFIQFKIKDSTVTQILVNVTPRNICGDGVSVSDTIFLNTNCLLPGDIDENGIVNTADILAFGRAMALATHENLIKTPRNLPCNQTGIFSKRDFYYHPRDEWLNTSGAVPEFRDEFNKWHSYENIDCTGDGLLIETTDEDTLKDFSVITHNWEKKEWNIGKSSNTGVVWVEPIEETDTFGSNLLFDLHIGDSLVSHDINMVYFSIVFKEGIHHRPTMDYLHSHLGAWQNLVKTDVFIEIDTNYSLVHVLMVQKDTSANVTFAGEKLCGVICEISVTRSPSSKSSADSLINGSFSYDIQINDVIVSDVQGNVTVLSGFTQTFQVEPLPQPKKVVGQAQSPYQNDLTWESHTVKPDSLIIERYLGDTSHLDMIDMISVDDYQSLDSINTGTYLYEDTSGIIPDQVYYYRIQTLNDTIGSSFWSKWAEVISGPAAPDSLALQSNLSTSIDITWKDNSPYADSTFVEVDMGNGIFVPIGASAMEMWTHNGLQPFSPYCYRIRTKNEYGVFSDYYTTQCCTTLPAVPITPNNISAVPLGNTAIVNWNIDTNSIIDKVYINRLKYSSSSPPQGFNDTIAAVNITQYVDTTVEQGYMYCYRLFTENASGSSFYSDTVCVLLCDMPTLTVNANEDTIRLYWTDNCNAESEYLIQIIDQITGDTTVTVFPYNTTQYEYILPSSIDTFSNCYSPAFHIVHDLYYSPYGNSDCVNGFIGERPIFTTEILNEDEQFKIYPNPTSSKLRIESLNNNIPLESIELLDLNGQVIFEYIVHHQYQMTLNLSDLPSAVYVLRINDDVYRKVIKTE